MFVYFGKESRLSAVIALLTGKHLLFNEHHNHPLIAAEKPPYDRSDTFLKLNSTNDAGATSMTVMCHHAT